MATAHAVAPLPNGMLLAQNEKVIDSRSFMLSLGHFFLHSELVLTDRRLTGQRPNTLFGLIPIGAEQISYPLKNISSVGTSTRIAFASLLWGIVLALFGLGTLSSIGVLLVLVGGFFLIGSFQAVFVVANNGGQKIPIKISLFDKSAAQSFANEINQTIAEHDAA